jgi:hypothetical protein
MSQAYRKHEKGENNDRVFFTLNRILGQIKPVCWNFQCSKRLPTDTAEKFALLPHLSKVPGANIGSGVAVMSEVFLDIPVFTLGECWDSTSN